MERLNLRPSGVPRSLYRQLLMGVGLCVVGVGVVTLGLNFFLMRSHMQHEVHRRAKTISQSLEFATEGLLEKDYAPVLQRVVHNYATLPAVVDVAVVHPTGKILAYAPHRANQQIVMQDQGVKTYAAPIYRQFVNASKTGIARQLEAERDNQTVLTYFLPFSSRIFQSTERRGVVIVTVNLQQMQHTSWQMLFRSMTIMTIGTLMMMFLIGWMLRRYLLSPLITLNADIAQSRVTGKLDIPDCLPKNEIRFLAETFQQVLHQRNQIESELREREKQEREQRSQLTETLCDLRNTQVQLIQAEKMAGLGQMVAGIAHEINNPVNFIHGNLDYALSYFQDLCGLLESYEKEYPQPTTLVTNHKEEIDYDFVMSDLPRLLQSLSTGTERIQTIVSSLKTFSHLDEAERKPVDIHEGLESTLLMLQSRLRQVTDYGAIRIIRDFDHQIPLVDCHVSSINQVFLSILSNAVDALHASRMDERQNSDRGLLPITEGNRWPADSAAVTLPRILVRTRLQGLNCIISIMDNGPGIPPDVLPKIFNPFFTTKPVGQGTGMGLSVSYQIIDNHGGQLECASKQGRGTEFTITLPI